MTGGRGGAGVTVYPFALLRKEFFIEGDRHVILFCNHFLRKNFFCANPFVHSVFYGEKCLISRKHMRQGMHSEHDCST